MKAACIFNKIIFLNVFIKGQRPFPPSSRKTANGRWTGGGGGGGLSNGRFPWTKCVFVLKLKNCIN